MGGLPALVASLLPMLLLAAGAVAASSTASRLAAVEAGRSETGAGAWIRLRTDGPVARVESFALEDPPRLVIDLPGLESAVAASVLEIGAAQAVRVRVGRHPDRVRVVIDAGGAPDAFEGRRIVPAPDGLVVALGFGESLDRVVATLVSGAAPAPPRAAPATARVLALAPVAARPPPAAPPPEPSAPPAAPPPGLALQFDDAEIAEVVQHIARETDTPVLFDPAELRGAVTITGADRVSEAEALEILHAALLVKGFAAVPSPGGARKIVRISASGESAPWTLRAAGETDAPIATLVRLRAADAQSVLTALRPWLGVSVLGLAHAPTNSLILAGAEARLRRVLAAVRALDEAAREELIVRRLRHASAETVAEMLRVAFSGAGPGRGLEVWPDERTQGLILRGEPERLAEARRFVERIDRPAEGLGELHVVRVFHQDPEQLAERLRELAGAGSALPAAVEGAGALSGRDFAVAVDRPTHSLVLRSDPQTVRLLAELIEQLDREPPRVAVELLVFEISMPRTLRLGFDFLVPLVNPRPESDLLAALRSDPGGGGFQSEPDASTSLLADYTRLLLVPIVGPDGAPALLEIPRERAQLTAHEREIRTRVLMRPHLLMMAGEEHELFSGDDVPIPSAQTDAAGGDDLQVRQNIERQDVGLTVRLRPDVGQAGDVSLSLELEASALGASLAGPVERVGPTIRQRRLTSKIQLRDGELALVAVSRDPLTERIRSGVPFLKDVPVLGALFRQTDERQLESHLLIAVQARVHRSASEDVAESIRRRIGFERSLARVQPLAAASTAPWAVLVTTRAAAGDAEALADRLSAPGRPARVSAWEWNGDRRFDVYLTGFETLREAGAAALRLRDAGFHPEVAVLPEAG